MSMILSDDEVVLWRVPARSRDKEPASTTRYEFVVDSGNEAIASLLEKQFQRLESERRLFETDRRFLRFRNRGGKCHAVYVVQLDRLKSMIYRNRDDYHALGHVVDRPLSATAC